MVPTLDSSTQADIGCFPLASSGFKQTQHMCLSAPHARFWPFQSQSKVTSLSCVNVQHCKVIV